MFGVDRGVVPPFLWLCAPASAPDTGPFGVHGGRAKSFASVRGGLLGAVYDAARQSM